MYKQKKMNLKNIFSFWNRFNEEEKFLFYNPNEKKLLMGAKRLKTFKKDESFDGYKYVFSIKTFFEAVKDSIWNGFVSENIAFCYYLVVKNGEQTLYYNGNDIEIEDVNLTEEDYEYKVLNKDYNEWRELFNASHNKILSKDVDKVVISREVAVDLSKEAKEEVIIKRLMDNNKRSFTFAYKKCDKCFLGATPPEILLEKKDDKIISHAVAGTLLKDRENQGEGKEEFLNDKKNSYEHNLVVSTIKNIFDSFGKDTTVFERELMEAKNLYHLHTKLLTYSVDDIITWRDRLHPTPALGGAPKDRALNIISENEFHERGMYASPIGVIDENGNGIFVVGIRSGILYKDKLYGYAGCGIVETSDCMKEFIETEGKLKTILECL